MWTICLAVLVGAVVGLIRIVVPALGIDSNESISFHDQPFDAMIVVVGGLAATIGFTYLGAVVAAIVAHRFFARAEVRSEFQSLLWLPGIKSANARLFDRLFPAPRSSDSGA
jgi:NADH:ubiquinone oxidoreductase subunit 6 (subunit J)